jgi:pimeloyl-ACP methyl ester carboxylesterase
LTPEPFLEKQFHSAEALLFYVEGPPHGTPIVLIHGAGSRWQPFQPILPKLSETYHVYALDLRGHGRSSHTAGAYHLDDFTRDVHHFIMEEVQAPVAIYGHSLGALVAINLAAKQPQDLCALILGDPPLYHHDTTIQDTFWHQAFIDLLDFMIAHPDPVEMESWLAHNIPTMTPGRRAERVRSLEGLDPDVIRAIISNKQMKGVNFTDLVRRVLCPVLLLRGKPTLGSALREQDVNFAMTHFPNIRMLEMETVGHGIVPAELLPQVMEFLGAAGED